MTLTEAPIAMQTSHTSLIHPGFGDYLYLIHGSSYWTDHGSYAFLRYQIDDDKGVWEELTSSSFAVITFPIHLRWSSARAISRLALSSP